jgi:hypothetical protein
MMAENSRPKGEHRNGFAFLTFALHIDPGNGAAASLLSRDAPQKARPARSQSKESRLSVASRLLNWWPSRGPRWKALAPYCRAGPHEDESATFPATRGDSVGSG